MGAIRPEVLTWARETAGLSLEEAARAIGLKEARGETGPERLAKIEEAGDPPRPLLLRMTKAYRRPLLVFYLSQPPRRGDRGQDFRTLTGEDPYNADLDALIRDIKGRQGLIRSILEDEEAEGPGFVGTATMKMPAAEVARRISENLGFSLAAFRGEKTGDDAFAYLRAQDRSRRCFCAAARQFGQLSQQYPVGNLSRFCDCRSVGTDDRHQRSGCENGVVVYRAS